MATKGKQGGGFDPPPTLLDIPVPDDYAPGPGEIDNLIYLTLRYTIDWTMRHADKMLVMVLTGGEPIVGKGGISQLVWSTCCYAWDHVAGEPANASPARYYDHMSNVLQVWYKCTTKETREKIE